MALLVVVLLVGVAIAIGAQYFRYKAKAARTNAVATIGRNIGFTFSARDDDGIASMPFVLFSRGKDRGVELVISGTHDGVPMRLFDYWYYDETSDSRGNRSRQYHRFTCALATIPAACPRLQIGYENFLTRLGDHFGLRDVVLEYDEFNRRFRVKCDDQKFAFSLLDGKMMEWLLASASFKSLEIDGPWALVAVDKLAPAQWLALGSWLEQFHRQIPPVVYSTYPPR